MEIQLLFFNCFDLFYIRYCNKQYNFKLLVTSSYTVNNVNGERNERNLKDFQLYFDFVV